MNYNYIEFVKKKKKKSAHFIKIKEKKGLNSNTRVITSV